ncbi:uncharacterized protein LOC128882687 isoform X2 [Hylaeus volcanicus]|nr:uncharacterized protein LOC128882687 isoform X2 [Hylaeus volcanicus]
MAQNYTISLQRLTSTFNSYQDALTLQMSKIKSALRTTNVFLNRQGIRLEGLLPEPGMTQNFCTDQDMHQDIYWRGISISISQSLLHFSKMQTVEDFIQNTLDPALRIVRSNEKVLDMQLFSSILQVFQSFELCIEDSSSKIRQYLLDTNFTANHTQLFVLESVFRDLSKIAAIEGQCTLLYVILKSYSQENTIHFVQAFENPLNAFYSPHLLVTITNIILQIIQALTNEISSSCFPDALQNLNETHAILLRHFVLWTRTIRDIRGMGICLTLNTSVTEREEAYVLLARIMERKSEFRINEKDLMLPLTHFWENSPFVRISNLILSLDSFLDTLLSSACLLNTSSLIMSQHISKAAESSDTQQSLHHLSKMLPNFLTMPSLKPIPFTPITFDLASCYFEEFHELEKEDFKCFSTIDKHKEPTTSFVGRLAAWWKK